MNMHILMEHTKMIAMYNKPNAEGWDKPSLKIIVYVALFIRISEQSLLSLLSNSWIF